MTVAGAVLLTVTVAVAAPGRLVLVSISEAGAKGDQHSSVYGLSKDGRKVGFSSTSTTLHPDDTDALQDVYVKDVSTGEMILASTSAQGVKGNGHSVTAYLSRSGNRVAFSSEATNLHPDDSTPDLDVYVKVISTGALILASTSDSGVKGNGDSGVGSISADGRTVAFWSEATNLDPADPDTTGDVYVKNLVTGDIALASTSDAGVKGNGEVGETSLSANGTRVGFSSDATNLDPADTDDRSDVYVKDLATGNLMLVSVPEEGAKAQTHSLGPSLSTDGTLVAFYSRARNLHPGDTDTWHDVFVKDLTTGGISLASATAEGRDANFESTHPSISADGLRVAFESWADNLSEEDGDDWYDVYVKDLCAGELLLASTTDSGEKGNSHSQRPVLSTLGTWTTFSSIATNLDPADEDGVSDVYLKRLIFSSCAG
jgi:hypothetical protein